MGFGKAPDVPAAPDYAPIAQADAKAAQMQFDLGQQQLDWAKEQSARYDPYITQYLDAQTQTTEDARRFAEENIRRYQGEFVPVEQRFTQTALGWNTPERAAQQAGMARADVSQTIDAQRQAALTNLQSYGIDPSTTRYGALDAGYRISKAAAEAAASTQSRQQTEQQQLALLGSAIEIGAGRPGTSAQFYNTATAAGAAGTRAGDTHFATGAGAMGSPTSYFGGGNTALGNQAQAMNYGYNNALGGAQLGSNVAMAQAKGVGDFGGKLIGTALPFLLGSDRRMKRDIEQVGYIGRLPLYTFNYLWDTLYEEPRYGFMADEVREVVPEAVSQVDGYDYVDYSLAIPGAVR